MMKKLAKHVFLGCVGLSISSFALSETCEEQFADVVRQVQSSNLEEAYNLQVSLNAGDCRHKLSEEQKSYLTSLEMAYFIADGWSDLNDQLNEITQKIADAKTEGDIEPPVMNAIEKLKEEAELNVGQLVSVEIMNEAFGKEKQAWVDFQAQVANLNSLAIAAYSKIVFANGKTLGNTEGVTAGRKDGYNEGLADCPACPVCPVEASILSAFMEKQMGVIQNMVVDQFMELNKNSVAGGANLATNKAIKPASLAEIKRQISAAVEAALKAQVEVKE